MGSKDVEKVKCAFDEPSGNGTNAPNSDTSETYEAAKLDRSPSIAALLRLSPFASP